MSSNNKTVTKINEHEFLEEEFEEDEEYDYTNLHKRIVDENGVLNGVYEIHCVREGLFERVKKKRTPYICSSAMYKNGKKEGDSTQYFTNGLVNKKEIYKNDILHGVSEWYFDANDMAHYTKELYYRGNLIVARSCQNGKTRQNDIGRMNLCKREEELGKIMKELLSPESFKVLVRNSTIRKITDFDTGLSEITEMLIEADMEF